MRSKGNGTPALCANNLLCIVRGEVPFERVKGLDPRLIDKPFSSVPVDLEIDARKIVEAYEPRVRFNGISFAGEDASGGEFSIIANVTEKEDG